MDYLYLYFNVRSKADLSQLNLPHATRCLCVANRVRNVTCHRRNPKHTTHYESASRKRTAPAATQSAICTENLMECGRAISQTSSPTDRQTDRQTDGLIAILRRFLVGGGLIAKFHYTDQTRTRPDPHGPARTFLRRNSVGSVRVRSGPCSGI